MLTFAVEMLAERRAARLLMPGRRSKKGISGCDPVLPVLYVGCDTICSVSAGGADAAEVWLQDIAPR
jgi:hypothetical protein